MKHVYTIAIPVRIDSEDRLENLRTVLAWVMTFGCPIVVLEADKESMLQDIVKPYQQVEYLFFPDQEEIFHRTKYINILLRHIQTDVVAIWDADVIIPLHQCQHAVLQIMEQGVTLAYPYNGIFRLLSPKQSVQFRMHMDILLLQSMKVEPLMGRTACGGAYFVDRRKYMVAGGENEKFVGWGPEDAERLHRIQILGQKAVWTTGGPLYHLHHGRDVYNTDATRENLLRMRKEFVKECCMDHIEMQSYVAEEMCGLVY